MSESAPPPRPDPNDPPLLHPADVLDYFGEYQRQHDAVAAGRALGPILPSMPKLAAAIGGWLPVGLTVMHGPPGAGKTALACQLAAESGCPAMVVSFEMAFLELLHRQAARITGTYIGKFRSRELAPSVWLDHMRRTVHEIPDLRILDVTRGSIFPKGISAKAEATRGNSEHLLIVIDSAHSMVRRTKGGATEYDALGELLDDLKVMAAGLSCSILVVAEQNRASRGTARQDAASSHRGFEYDGEIVIALSHENVRPDADGEIPIKATLGKNRHGEEGSVDLRFCGRRMAFREDDALVSSSHRNGKV